MLSSYPIVATSANIALVAQQNSFFFQDVPENSKQISHDKERRFLPDPTLLVHDAALVHSHEVKMAKLSAIQ
jgi:hypothetical protein